MTFVYRYAATPVFIGLINEKIAMYGLTNEKKAMYGLVNEKIAIYRLTNEKKMCVLAVKFPSLWTVVCIAVTNV